MTTTILALLAFVPIGVWLVWFYTRDPRREPVLLIAMLFLLGLGATVPSAVLNRIWQELTLGSTFAVQLQLTRAPILAVGVYFLLVAIGEEAMKLVFALPAVTRDASFDEPVDGMVYLTTIALGFAAAENFDYLLGTFRGSLSGGLATASAESLAEVAAARAFLNTLGHVAWSGIIGYVIAARVLRRQRRRLLAVGVIAAVGLHALFDLSWVGAARIVPADRTAQVAVQAFVIVASIGIYAVLFRRAARQAPA